jgi:hypothetical protein
MTYLSTAPVVGLAWISFTAGFIIEIVSDPLVFLSNFKSYLVF